MKIKILLAGFIILAIAGPLVYLQFFRAKKVEVSFQQASAYSPPAGSPLALNQHPRIWINQSELPTLQAKLETDFKTEYQNWVNYLNTIWTSVDTASDYYAYIHNYAFVYQMSKGSGVAGISYGAHTPAQFGDKAKTLLINYANSLIAAGRLSKSFRTFDGWMSFPIGYDWTYELMTNTERTTVINGLKLYITKADNDFKELLDDQSTAAIGGYTLAALSFYGDGIDNITADTFLTKSFTSGFYGGGTMDAANIVAADDGASSEGLNYALHGSGNSTMLNILRTQEAWRTALGQSRATAFGGNAASVLRYFPQWVGYLSLPYQANTTLKTWHDDSGNPYMTHQTMADILYALRLYKNIDPQMASLSQYFINTFGLGIGTSGFDGGYSALESLFIFGEKGITGQSPSQLGLPISKKFDGYGQIFMRGWNASDSVVTFTASPFWRTFYSNSNQNSFTIDRKGPLALNAGTRVHHDWSNTSLAFNTIVFPNPNSPTSDDGGQRKKNGGSLLNTSMWTIGSARDIGPGIKRYDAITANGQDYDYIYSDSTRAYNGPQYVESGDVSKVKLFTRSLVYFRPTTPGGNDKVIVFDRTETVGTQFEKRWILHPSGKNISINGAEVKQRDGKWIYNGGDTVTATQTSPYSGKLYSQTLLPANALVYKVGGPDNAGADFTTLSHEFENSFGVQDVDSAGGANDYRFIGNYRIEVTPSTPSLKDNFLHVLEATDATGSQSSTGLLSGSGLVGARTGNRIAVFNTQEANITSGNITIDQAGTYSILFSDLTPSSSYTFNVAGTNQNRTASSQGTVYLTNTNVGANSTISLSTGGAPPPPPPPTTYQRTIRIDLEGPTSKALSGTLEAYSSTGILLKTYPFTTNSTGDATITFDIPVQTVKLRVIAPKYLKRNLLNINLSTTSTYVFIKLLAGDLNQDNIINSIDFSQLNSRWFQNDSTKDINMDGVINSVDFSLMNKNWFVGGDS